MAKHFISYTEEEGAALARRLHEALETGPPPIPVWLDHHEIQTLQDWDTEVGKALKACLSLLFVMTHQSVEDAQCASEWTQALRYNKPVILLKLHPDAETPFDLTPREPIDFTGALESNTRFKSGLTRLRKRLLSLYSPEGVYQTLKERLADYQRDLRNAPDAAARRRIKKEIDNITREITDGDAAARSIMKSIDRHQERQQPRKRKSAKPAAVRPGRAVGIKVRGVEQSERARSVLQPKNQSSRIFICYRRDDSSGHAGRLHDRLSEVFNEDQVFMDIDTIEPGDDFVSTIEEAVGSCSILLAIIGKRWLGSVDDAGKRRLDNDEDFVRLEISSALNRNVRVIPVLVQGASMPSSRDLPESLAKLARLSALDVSDTRWKYDLERLVETLRKRL